LNKVNHTALLLADIIRNDKKSNAKKKKLYYVFIVHNRVTSLRSNDWSIS